MFMHDIIKSRYSKEGYLMNYPYHLISDAEMFDAFICYRMEIPQQDALKVTQGTSTLWEEPKKYVSLYQLKGFEVDFSSSTPKIILEGNKSKMTEFNQLSGLDRDILLSPECYFSSNYPLMYDSLSESYNRLVDAIDYHINTYLQSLDTSTIVPIPTWVYSYMLNSTVGVNSSRQDIHDLLVLLGMDNPSDELTEEVMQECLDISTKWVRKLPPSKNVMRPPTMYGEPHVIKSLRISGLLVDEDRP